MSYLKEVGPLSDINYCRRVLIGCAGCKNLDFSSLSVLAVCWSRLAFEFLPPACAQTAASNNTQTKMHSSERKKEP